MTRPSSDRHGWRKCRNCRSSFSAGASSVWRRQERPACREQRRRCRPLYCSIRSTCDELGKVRISLCSSFQRRLESSFFNRLQKNWIPAFAGMTPYSEVPQATGTRFLINCVPISATPAGRSGKIREGPTADQTTRPRGDAGSDGTAAPAHRRLRVGLWGLLRRQPRYW